MTKKEYSTIQDALAYAREHARQNESYNGDKRDEETVDWVAGIISDFLRVSV